MLDNLMKHITPGLDGKWKRCHVGVDWTLSRDGFGIHF